ncbi:MAG: bacillithiol biosynthesis cysteine-adding enzyme BshC [Bacteroidota bacterium]
MDTMTTESPVLPLIRFPFQDVPQFSSRDLAYVAGDSSLTEFFEYATDLDAFEAIIKAKQGSYTSRKITSEYIKTQYEESEVSEALQQNLNFLHQENTFTIVTGHQPSLATGPLYFIYKIASVIRLCRQLSERYPAFNFVPIYWLGSEDHDFEEINHFNLFGQTFVWEQDQKGPVGKLSTEGIRELFPTLFEKLGDRPNAEKLKALLRNSYGSHEQLDGATFQLVHDLFQKHGLVIIQANDPVLKRAFIPFLERELFDQASFPLVNQTIQELEAKGFKAQASPREINLFYMKPGLRERIVKKGAQFEVLNSDIRFSESELKEELHQHPERFSPNVIMRPLYQEFLLPNLAYVGGGGEIAYWLERKRQFEHFGIPFPMLVRRASALFIDKGSSKKIDKLGLQLKNIFQEEEALIKAYVKERSDSDFQFGQAIASILRGFSEMAAEADKVDPTLIKTVKAEEAKALKSIEQIKGRLIKAEKRNQETAVNQIRSLKDKLFPGKGLQERKDNFISIYLKHGQGFIDQLVDTLDPLEKVVYIFRE